MSMKKTEDTPLRMLEKETGYALYFTTQMSLVVRCAFCEKMKVAKSSVLATKKTNP